MQHNTIKALSIDEIYQVSGGELSPTVTVEDGRVTVSCKEGTLVTETQGRKVTERCETHGGE